MQSAFQLPQFSVVVWLRKTEKFEVLKSELLTAADRAPYESTEHQGMVDFHWSAASLTEAKRLAEALTGAAQHPELVLLRNHEPGIWRRSDFHQGRAPYEPLMRTMP